MNLSCIVIEDLLPAYCDGTCTADSRAAVEEHLADCPRCRRFYTALHRPLPLEEPRKNPPPLRSVEKRWKKEKRVDLFRGGILALFVGVAVFLVMAALQFKVSIPLSQEDIVINQVVQLSDGSINVGLWVDDTAHSIAYEWSEEEHVLYLVPYRSFFVFEDSSWDGWQSDITFYVLPEGETEAPDKIGVPLPPDTRAICVGPKKDAILVWEEGQELPPARSWSSASKKNGWLRNTGKPPHVRAHSDVRGLMSWGRIFRQTTPVAFVGKSLIKFL